MNPLRSTFNRTLLTLTGAALLAGGLWLTATASAVHEHLPAWWPTAAPGTVLLDRSGLAELRGHGWWTPAAITATACALLLCLTWFLAQLRAGGHRRLSLASPALTLRPHALAAAIARRAEATPGIAGARVRLLARPKRSRGRVRVLLDPGTEPATALARLSAGALDEARRSLAPGTVDLYVRLGVRSRRERRTR